jgi:hypothetical protein
VIRPCSPAEAVDRAVALLGRTEPYVLGTGDYRGIGRDPWTTRKDGKRGCDCWGLIAHAYRLPRHRPGYNKGKWATVSDDMNCDSAIEQAEHITDDPVWALAGPQPAIGDVLVWPSIRGPDRKRLRIGHVAIVVAVPAEWAPERWDWLTVVQCQSSRQPAIMRGPGSAWRGRETWRGATDTRWRSRLLRVRETEPAT